MRSTLIICGVLTLVVCVCGMPAQEVEPADPAAQVPVWKPDDNLLSDTGDDAMVAIPAGGARVGVRHPVILRSIPERRRKKHALRSMEIDAFRIDRYEVTNGNYYKFLQTLPEKSRNAWTPRHHIKASAIPTGSTGTTARAPATTP